MSQAMGRGLAEVDITNHCSWLIKFDILHSLVEGRANLIIA